MAILRGDIFTFKYFHYGQAFHGSYRGMRYTVQREPLVNVFFESDEKKADGFIRAYVWPEPFCFDDTPDEQKIYRDFEYSEKGVLDAIDFLNETWESDYARP